MTGSNLYTRTGDDGMTSLADGTRISKASLRVEAYGSLDEANAFVGAALALTDDEAISGPLSFVMHRLFNCTSRLANPRHASPAVDITGEDVAFIERAIDALDAASGPISGFVLPTGTRLAAELHRARTVCRRAERRLLALNREEAVAPRVLEFVNRTSDLLFASARYANRLSQHGDIFWDRARGDGS